MTQRRMILRKKSRLSCGSWGITHSKYHQDENTGILWKCCNISSYLSEDKVSPFDEKLELMSKTKDKKLLECIKSARKIQAREVTFEDENPRLLSKFRNKMVITSCVVAFQLKRA